MKIVFSTHAKQRFEQRARLNIGAGYNYVKRASKTEINPIHQEYINKYKEKQTDPTLTVIAYKHLMFVARIKENEIFVVTVLVAH